MFISIFRRDLRYGFLNFMKKAFLGFVLIAILIVLKVLNINEMNTIIDIQNSFDFSSYFLFFVSGVGFLPPSEVSIPFEFTVIVVFAFFSIGDFLYSDLKENGIYVILRTKDKVAFWMSKVLWVVFCLVFYFIVIFLMILFGSIFLSHGEVNLDLLFIPIIGFLLMAFLTISLSIAQVFFTLMIKTIVALAINCVLYISSIYIFLPILPWQYGMVARSEMLDSQFGIPLMFSLIYIFGVGIISIFLGRYVIKSKDIL